MDSSVAAINWMQTTFGENSRYFFDFFSFFGGPYGWTILIPFVSWRLGSKAGIRLSLVVIVTMIFNTLLKWGIAQPRPFFVSDQVHAIHAVSGFGMPSGHAQGVAAVWLTVAYSVRRSWCVWLAILFIVCTGAARVYFGVHSHQQVAIGWTLGLISALLAIRLEPTIIRWFQSKPQNIQLASVVGVTAAFILTGYIVGYELRGDLVTPNDWQDRWQNTVDRLETDTDHTPSELTLIRRPLVAGMAALFLLFSIRGIRLASRSKNQASSTE